MAASASSTSKHCRRIDNRFTNVVDIIDELVEAEIDTKFIFGIDYTQSNLKMGEDTFDGKNLHTIKEGTPNPYQQVLQSLCHAFPEDDGNKNLIDVFGFGDKSTQGKSVFPFRKNGCNGIKAVLSLYQQITEKITMSGPTNFAPLINEAIQIVKKRNSHHLLVIIADGQVSSKCKQQTEDAIVRASNYPLSIVMVGVGDGPWNTMEKYDDQLPKRRFDNFQFVDFHGVAAESLEDFVLEALMEVPDQVKEMKKLGYKC